VFKPAVYVTGVRDNISPSNHVTIMLILAKNKLIILHKSHVFFISWIARYECKTSQCYFATSIVIHIIF